MHRVEQTLAHLARRKLLDFLEVSAADFELGTCLNFLRSARALGVGIKAEWTRASFGCLESFLPEVLPLSLRLPLEIEAQAHAMLAQSASILVFSPSEEFVHNGARNSGLRALIDAGAAVALSSGYDVQQTTSVSMQMALALAVIRLQMKDEEAICAATVNAACALGIGHRTGTLEVGKQADLMVLSVGDYRELARQFGINHVGMIMRRGSLVLNRTRWRPGGL
jgi:imidazolonepropionase